MKYLLPLLSFALAACDNASEREPITMSVIGSTLAMQDPDSGRGDAANALMLSATAQGLLAFDNAGQVEPGLAERWIVTDDGLSIIFRLRNAGWTSGGKVMAADVVRSLRMHMAANRRNPLRPHFANVGAVVAMTDKVVEIRLKQPDPTFLPILAQPEMAIFKRSGTGAYQVHSQRNGIVRLRPIPPLQLDGAKPAEPPDQSRDVRVRAESAQSAVVRFQNGGALLVSGGSYADLSHPQTEDVNQASLRLEYPMGLFGLLATNAPGPISDRGVRIALSVAIDREALVDSAGAEGWRSALALLPASLGSASPPAALELAQRPMEDRRARARTLISSIAKGSPLRIRVALSQSPGSRLLFARLKADWSHIGVEAIRVETGQNADLVLIDRVAAFPHALWFMETITCAPGMFCADSTSVKIAALRTMLDPAEQAAAISAVDAELAATHAFIPLATPLRWSLVASGLGQWKTNRYATHPIQYLRDQ